MRTVFVDTRKPLTTAHRSAGRRRGVTGRGSADWKIRGGERPVSGSVTGCRRPEAVIHLDHLDFRLAAIEPAFARNQEMVWNSVAAQSVGNFNSRSITWKRGSLRKGSMSGSVFRRINPGSRTRSAVSSHSSALGVLPHCA